MAVWFITHDKWSFSAYTHTFMEVWRLNNYRRSHHNEKYNGYCTQKRQDMQCSFFKKKKKIRL